MNESAEVRKRNPAVSGRGDKPAQASPAGGGDERTNKTRGWGRGSAVLDILRVLGGVLLLSGTLSYLATGNKSFVWGYNLNPARVKAWIRGPLHLTPSQLLLHDGRSNDPSMPIYLALNGTIYDVSASPHLYGPGGSYHFFAGRDATRAFVTGCFEEDLTGDLRGVERMFVPRDEEGEGDGGGEGERREGGDKRDGDGREIRRERKIRREREVREAKRKVWDAVEGWRVVFDGGKGGKYFRVGVLVDREEGWGEEIPRLCEKAEKARPKRGGGE